MAHALVTIIAPIDPARVAEAESAIDRLGNPATSAIAEALGRRDGDESTHFASLHAVRSVDGARGHIVFEFSADGTDDRALARVVTAIGVDLRPVFMLASDWKDGNDLARYLKAHSVKVGGGWFDNPGLPFVGTPGMSVGRILAEDGLAKKVAARLGLQHREMSALERVADVRKAVAADSVVADMLGPATPFPPFAPADTPSIVLTLAGSFVRTYLWPIALVILIAAAFAGFSAAWNAQGFWHGLGAAALEIVKNLWGGFWIGLFFVLAVAVLGYGRFREAEAEDWLEEHPPARAINDAMFAHENGRAQNHMISVTQRKPGMLRSFTQRLAFWIIGSLAPLQFRPGFLGTIGTIHFARWVTPPGSPDVIFLSNYGGSWESYLEDFITRAHEGLTAVWSNTIGFPRSENLFLKGATDGDRFKRFARQSMVPTRFWYSAYPDLTTATIRSNAEIRRGFSGVMTEDEAIAWLALFGSGARPANKIVSSGVQSLIFGGLGFLPFGTCLILDLPEDREAAKAWLREIFEFIAFDDGRRLGKDDVLTLALGPRGLDRLGLPKTSLESFPFAFLEGMTRGHRARILGDTDQNAPEHWRWGRDQPDAVLLVYALTEQGRDRLAAKIELIGKRHGAGSPHKIPLKMVTEDKKEPFGFVDGVSQPVISGTHKGLRTADPIHLVEPGEFILGYPDNRGDMPPGPTMSALDDPENLLPLVGGVDGFDRSVVETARDVGFNGSFLVIRELEQDDVGFSAYCEREAEALGNRLPSPYKVDAEFIAAKLVGRWKDGSSLVRNPYESRTSFVEHVARRNDRLEKAEAARKSAAGKEALTTSEAGPMVISAASADLRPKSAPGGGVQSIDAASAKHEDKRGADAGRPVPNYGDNTFLFGAEDPEAIRCPFGAHIRRANPRDSQDPGSADQIAISNRHRTIRIGRQYQPAEGEKPGLLFMCLNGNIERQFEFLQQTWLMSPSFHGLSCEKDPVLGDAEQGNCGFTIPSRYGPIHLNPLPRFVTVRGGGYFFLPGKRLLTYLTRAR